MSLFLMSWSCQNKKEQFTDAVMRDASKELINLLEIYPEEEYDCFEMNRSRYNLLAIAIKFNRSKCFEVLISKNFDLDHQCSNKNALMYAAKYGKTLLVLDK